jgi:hypothetical protein
MSRISEKNIMFNKINDLNVNKARAMKFIENAACTLKDRSYISKTREENLLKIQEIDREILTLEERIRSLDQGELDQELEEIQRLNKLEAEKNNKALLNKAINDKKIKQLKIQKINSIYKVEREEKYKEKQKQRDMKYALDRYNSILLPEYMSENLKNMPSNKGYIWNGVWFFGGLPEVNGPTVMFEKQGNSNYVHEIYPTEYNIYKKNLDKSRELIHKQIRKPIIITI